MSSYTDDEKKYIANIAQYCHQVIVAKRPEKPWTLTNIIQTGFGKYPFLVVRNYSTEAKSAVIEKLRAEQFDLIHAETFYIMPNLPQTKIPTLLVEQTIEYLVYQQFVRDFKLWLLKPLLYFDVLKINLWEKYFWRKATHLVTMSAEDKQFIAKEISATKIDVVANGVDIDRFDSILIDCNTIIINFSWKPD